jgi:aspartyl-tRNA(Asn)/glutamyl-tRNA(Gln) amidotransferase subunit B
LIVIPSAARDLFFPTVSWHGSKADHREVTICQCYNLRSVMPKSTPEASPLAPEVLAKYEPVIGLEVHVQLLTRTKIFCGCSTRFGDPPNTNVCPVCLGLPGTLPVLNKRAVEMAMRAALALNCTVHDHSRFARKNYFYPDLPKGYQISQYELPLATGGWLEIEVSGTKKRIGITRLHLEEDAAKNLHEGFSQSATKAYIDYNRCGTPLSEIVSEPDMRTPEEAYAYLTTLRQILLYTGVSDVNMEEGSLRCDANVSVRPRGSREFGTKVEVKNLNSFRFLQKALEFEIERHIAVLETGGRIAQETRLWNQAEGYTVGMRSKEKAHDYRYFPEPDLLPVHVSSAWRDEVRRSLPELPEAKRARFVLSYGLSLDEAAVLTETQKSADYFEAVVTSGADPKQVASWMQRLTHLAEMTADPEKGVSDKYGTVAAQRLAELIALMAEGKITSTTARTVLAKMFQTGHTAAEIVAAEGLGAQVSESAIEQAAREIIAKDFANVAKYKSGNDGVFKFFVGQVMKATRGQANPQAVNDILRKILSS